ncbi:crossover junction endodeoxyribonuclease RuvC, partial [Patescibacteria group bacterium]|nr:crossover junction endodeoxyribonuclease RuvC [Patescibacteria group bacterium]
MIIIGIDPGIAHTGFGIVRAKKKKGRGKSNLKCLGYGTVETKPGLPP